LVEYRYDAMMEVLGTKGVMLIGDLKSGMLSLCRKSNGVVNPAFPSWRDRFKEVYTEEVRHFIDCIVQNKKPKVTGNDGKKIVETVFSRDRIHIFTETSRHTLRR